MEKYCYVECGNCGYYVDLSRVKRRFHLIENRRVFYNDYNAYRVLLVSNCNNQTEKVQCSQIPLIDDMSSSNQKLISEKGLGLSIVIIYAIFIVIFSSMLFLLVFGVSITIFYFVDKWKSDRLIVELDKLKEKNEVEEVKIRLDDVASSKKFSPKNLGYFIAVLISGLYIVFGFSNYTILSVLLFVFASFVIAYCTYNYLYGFDKPISKKIIEID